MRLRPYIENQDFTTIAGWIDTERRHALWCANHFPYPIAADTFHDHLHTTLERWTISPFVVTDDGGSVIGFFRYSVDTQSNAGFLASVIVDDKLRGKGYGSKTIRLALRYAFAFTGAELVQLNVFRENTEAKRCYERIGFVERDTAKDVFVFQDETWHSCPMAIAKQQFLSRQAP